MTELGWFAKLDKKNSAQCVNMFSLLLHGVLPHSGAELHVEGHRPPRWFPAATRQVVPNEVVDFAGAWAHHQHADVVAYAGMGCNKFHAFLY